MEKVTVMQVAYQLGVSTYTVKRWYEWFENEDVNKLNELAEKGMPQLPVCERFGANKARVWNENDIEQIRAWQEWYNTNYTTKNGFIGKINKKEK